MVTKKIVQGLNFDVWNFRGQSLEKTYFNLHRLSSMEFLVSHIYIEGNHVADKMASFALQSSRNIWWHNAPDFVIIYVASDMSFRPFYHFY